MSMRIVEWMSTDGKNWKKFCEFLYAGETLMWDIDYWKTKLPYILGGYKYWKVEVIKEGALKDE